MKKVSEKLLVLSLIGILCTQALIFTDFFKSANAAVLPGQSGTISMSCAIPGTWHLDVDYGTNPVDSLQSDLWWRQINTINRELIPENGALIANLGVVDFDTVVDASSYSLSNSPIIGDDSDDNQIPQGTVLVVRTNQGNYAKMRIDTYGYNLYVTVIYQPNGTPYLNTDSTYVTSQLLEQYDLVIATSMSYRSGEASLYQNYVSNGGKLLLLSDHGGSSLPDAFDLSFRGISVGENIVSQFADHQINAGVEVPLSYVVGSGLLSYPEGATILGWLSDETFIDLTQDGVQQQIIEPSGAPVIGCMSYGEGQILFSGDTNLFENVPQPFTENYLSWFGIPSLVRASKILVDATNDAGLWWSPQSENFDPTQDHQGKLLADYMRGLGATVTELARGYLPQGLTVESTVDEASPVPIEDWSYSLTYPDQTSYVFTIPAYGGTKMLPITTDGTYVLTQTKKYNYETTVNIDETVVPVSTENNKILLSLSNLQTTSEIAVVFDNAWVPDIAWAKPTGSGDSSPPTMNTYDIPCRVALPVQGPWNPDINSDSRIDLVKDKPIKVLVNLADLLSTMEGPVSPTDPTQNVQVILTATGGFFTPALPTESRSGSQIAANSVIIYSMNPPSTTGDFTLTCTINIDGVQYAVSDTLVSVKETSPLTLYYSHLSRSEYGTEPAASFTDMVTNTRDFIGAIYPVPSVTTSSNVNGISGEATQANFIGMLKDCQRIELEAKLQYPNSPNVIGVAIGPDLASGGSYKNYFAYHGAVSGKKTAVGVSFGPAVKGVVVSDGYYSAAAHEIGHTFGLYFGVPEQYTQYNPGAQASGFWPGRNEWRAGYDFMGLATYKSTTSTWVTDTTTFNPLFGTLKTPNDPAIIIVSGIILKDANGVTSADLSGNTWYSVVAGVPDSIPSGEQDQFALRFTLSDDSTVEIPFDAQFIMHIDPGVEQGEDLPGDFTGFGKIETNFAGFAFAVPYPQGTVQIDLVDTTRPSGSQVLATKPASEVIEKFSFGGFLPPINSDGSSIFKSGSTIPVKFQLKDVLGYFITDAKVTFSQIMKSAQAIGTVQESSTANIAGTSGTLFKYDLTNNQYVYNFKTSKSMKGTFEITATFEDGTSQSVLISLK